MGAVNRAILVGRLAADPQLYRTQSDRLRCTFFVVTGEAESERHRVVVWGARGERYAEKLHKGQLVYVEGRLRRYAFTARDGVRRVIVEVVAEQVLALETGGRRPQPVVDPPAPARPKGIYHAQPDFSRLFAEILDMSEDDED
ncbi:MAG: single-stranded DNA-binding protein [Myxococcales bacterium]|nr:single-stranded DNA-binding protein [Myxococcales bacterium]